MSDMAMIHEESRPEVDGRLRAFFQAEMPKAWPAFKAPYPPRRPTAFWSRSAGRLALAACVAVLVAGYLALAGNFPGLHSSNGVEPVGGPIGKKEPKAERHDRPMPFVPVD